MSKGNILVVDDDRFFRDLYKDMLISEGFSVKVAADGMVAAVLVRDETFDVVLMDMVMPEWNGIKTMGEIRKVQPDLDVIMVTHVSEIDTAVEAMKAGANDYVLKPINREDLLYAIRRLLKRQKILLEHSKLTQENVEFFEVLSIYKKCLGVLSVNDFETLVNVITDVMVAETGAGEGFFWFLENVDKGDWTIAASTVGSVRQKGKGLPLKESKWEKAIDMGLPFKWPSAAGETIYVPLILHGQRMGVVELFTKKGARKFEEREMKFAGIVSEFSQTALNNATKLGLLEKRSLLNEEFGVYGYRFFTDTMHKQLFISKRYRRPLSIAYLVIDNMDDLVKTFGAGTVSKALKKIVEKVLGVVRHSDIVAYKGKGEFFLLFPETDYFGSIMAVKRIEESVAGLKYVSDGVSSSAINLLLVSATYPRDGAEIETLLPELKSRSEELKKNLFHGLDLAEKGFWESVDVLLDEGKKLSTPDEIEMGVFSAPYFSSKFDASTYTRIRSLFDEEITTRPFLRGIFFFGVDIVSSGDPLCRKLGAVEDLAMRIFVVGRKGDGAWDIPNVTPVYLNEGEEPLRMLLFINEEAGYLYLGREGKGEEGCAFHTADLYTVEKMISKLRDHYLLQWI